VIKAKCRWQSHLSFTGEAGGFGVAMDANPSDSAASENATGPTPKQLALISILGCSAMDVISLLQKYKQNVTEFWVDSETDTTKEHPKVFTGVSLVYRLRGEIEETRAIEAVKLSMTKYCGVSAMFSKAVQISYEIDLNEKMIYKDVARF
jgi:putative redox protein